MIDPKLKEMFFESLDEYLLARNENRKFGTDNTWKRLDTAQNALYECFLAISLESITEVIEELAEKYKR